MSASKYNNDILRKTKQQANRKKPQPLPNYSTTPRIYANSIERKELQVNKIDLNFVLDSR